MAARRRRPKAAGPMLAELTLASLQTIAARTRLIATGACTPAEYRRMVREKVEAAQASTRALLRGQADPASLLAPWHKRARRNARRLGRKG